MAVNELIDEKSPYLLQHAQQPVHWLAWGQRPFQRAEVEDKPLFLSIGYSTCHWCHVMAEESFADPAIAAYLNRYFVAIKVDREERPDIDQLYMTATQIMSGSGGWPMSIFLLPNGEPFYAGTYFPPRSRGNRLGFYELLQSIQKLWQGDRGKLTSSASSLAAKIKTVATTVASATVLSDELVHLAFAQVVADFDERYGGFGRRPKFPRPVTLDFLLRYAKRYHEKKAEEMVFLTLEKMGQGGIYDHLGGGFHRYSVDEQWRVPHFEKMLYDQAQLALTYFDAFGLSAQSWCLERGLGILDFCLARMQGGEGGFYAAEDADSAYSATDQRHGEGVFYIWSVAEITAALAEDAGLFCFCYGVKAEGNVVEDMAQEFAGQNILYQAKSAAQAAAHFQLDVEVVEQRLAAARQKLLAVRQQRPRPHLDDKIITSWNGLIISALARAYGLTYDLCYLEAAQKAVACIKKNMIGSDNMVFRRFRDGQPAHAGQLDDYAFLVQGLLALYGVVFDVDLLCLAQEITTWQIEIFADEEQGGFFDAPQKDDFLLVRMKNDYDGAEPAGNSVAAMNLLRLAHITGNMSWQRRAEEIFACSSLLAKAPSHCPALLAAYDFSTAAVQQVVIVGDKGASDTQAMLALLHRYYLPETIVLLADDLGRNYLQGLQPTMAAMTQVDGRATAYVCQNFSCREPVNSVTALAGLLDLPLDG